MGNWKMNKTLPEAIEFAKQTRPITSLAKSNKIDVGIACPYIDLLAVKRIVRNRLIVASENVHYENSGAYTGEVSIPMLKSIGIQWAIVGHSERRAYNNETNETCNKKIIALLANDMIPIYCCGESLETFEAGKTKEWIKEQIVAGFKDVKKESMAKVVIAYEPIWSIGTGKNASSDIAEDICNYIRFTIHDLFGVKVANKIRIIYGGSVKPNNIREYLDMRNVDGALVGGASLTIESYKELLKNIIL